MKFNNELIYQIYPITFADSNGDGYGDLQGICEQLDYLAGIGVTYIWLSPVYPSKWRDNGYDVDDYCDVDKRFGGMEAFDILSLECKKKGIKIIMDIVANHSSDNNIWFSKSIQRDEKYSNYYVWRQKPVEGFDSQFENNSWTYNETRGEYYLHQFAKTQPDLNWENPELITEFRNILKFWVSKGVTGFRFDVADMLGKQIDKKIKIDVDRSFELWNKVGADIFTNNKLLTVGECWSTGRRQGAKYTHNNSSIFTTIFNARYMFMHENNSRWTYKRFTADSFLKYKKWLVEQDLFLTDSGVPNFIENHDFPRAISRIWNNRKHLINKAKLLCITHYLKRGISFIYQGQELGLPNPKLKSVNIINDIETIKFMDNNKSLSKKQLTKKVSFGTRDNSRAPLFGNKNNLVIKMKNSKHRKYFQHYNLNNKNSVLNLYKYVIKIKKEYSELFNNGNTTFDSLEDSNLMITKISSDRQELKIISAWFHCQNVEMTEYEILISNRFKNGRLKKYGYVVGIKKT